MKPEFDNRAAGALAPSRELPVNVDADHAPATQPVNALTVNAGNTPVQPLRRPRIVEQRARRQARRLALV